MINDHILSCGWSLLTTNCILFQLLASQYISHKNDSETKYSIYVYPGFNNLFSLSDWQHVLNESICDKQQSIFSQRIKQFNCMNKGHVLITQELILFYDYGFSFPYKFLYFILCKQFPHHLYSTRLLIYLFAVDTDRLTVPMN